MGLISALFAISGIVVGLISSIDINTDIDINTFNKSDSAIVKTTNLKDNNENTNIHDN